MEKPIALNKSKRAWPMLVLLGALLLPIPALADPCSMPAAGDGYQQLDAGFHALYDLDFARGERTFLAWESQHPGNPLGPASRAGGYLFQEFERLGVLRSEIFTDDQRFLQRKKLAPSRDLKARFGRELARADAFADQMLAQNPRSADALLAKTLVNGMQADYAGLIEKRDAAALSYTKEGRRSAERLLQVDPSCYDAYLALGAENYLVAIKPPVVRWLARLRGARADRDQGIRELTLTAEHGRFLKPFAKLLLALAAQRDHDPATARRLLAALHMEFPNNSHYRDELNKLESRSFDSQSKAPGNSGGADK